MEAKKRAYPSTRLHEDVLAPHNRSQDGENHGEDPKEGDNADKNAVWNLAVLDYAEPGVHRNGEHKEG